MIVHVRQRNNDKNTHRGLAKWINRFYLISSSLRFITGRQQALNEYWTTKAALKYKKIKSSYIIFLQTNDLLPAQLRQPTYTRLCRTAKSFYWKSLCRPCSRTKEKHKWLTFTLILKAKIYWDTERELKCFERWMVGDHEKVELLPAALLEVCAYLHVFLILRNQLFKARARQTLS